MKHIIALVFIIVAYLIFDVGYSLSNHLLGSLVKAIAGTLFMLTGKYYLKE